MGVLRNIDAASSTRAVMREHWRRYLGLCAVALTCVILASCTPAAAPQLDRSGEEALSGDADMPAGDDPRDILTLDTVRRMVGMDSAFGLSGAGVTVAIIDSGVYPHDDLILPKSRILAFEDIVHGETGPYDDYGHGTAIAGIIAGSGAMSDGIYQGIAPDCNLVVVKAVDSTGGARIDDLVTAVNWVADNKDVYGIKVLNISLGVVYDGENWAKLSAPVERLSELGVLLVTAVGNRHGNGDPAVFLPAAFEQSVAVGTVSELEVREAAGYTVAATSNWFELNGASKPDLVAPGRNVLSLQSDTTYRPMTPGPAVDEATNSPVSMNVSYSVSSGTSNSAAVVTGIAALLFQRHPDATADEVKGLILDSCTHIDSDNTQQGQGFFSWR
jgi:serine protease AprX